MSGSLTGLVIAVIGITILWVIIDIVRWKRKDKKIVEHLEKEVVHPVVAAPRVGHLENRVNAQYDEIMKTVKGIKLEDLEEAPSENGEDGSKSDTDVMPSTADVNEHDTRMIRTIKMQSTQVEHLAKREIESGKKWPRVKA